MEPFITRRSNYALLMLVLLVLGLIVATVLVRQRQEIRQKAAPSVSLEVTPPTITVNQQDQFTLDVVLDAGSQQTTKADVVVTYDNTVIDGISATASNFFPTIVLPGIIGNGVARFTLEAPSTSPKSGRGTLATLTFKARNPTSTTLVAFSTSTEITLVDGTQAAALFHPSALTINRTVYADTTLNFSTPDTTLDTNTEFDVALTANPGVNQLATADVTILYDPTYLEGISTTIDTENGYLPKVLTNSGFNDGSLHLVLGSSTVGPAIGEGTMAVVRFKSKAYGTTQLRWDVNSLVRVVNSDENMVKSKNDLTLTVVAPGTQTPTPTPVPTPSVDPCAGVQPPIPTNVSAVPVSTTAVDVRWTPQANVTHYGLAYGTSSRSYIYGASDVGNVASFTVSSLTPNTAYYFAVFSVNDCNASNYSTEASATTLNSVGGVAIATPSPYVYASSSPYGVPTPSPSFMPIDPNGGSEQMIPFLANKTGAGTTNVPTPPTVVVPPEFINQNEEPTPWWQSVWFGILLILLAVVAGIIFLRMKRE